MQNAPTYLEVPTPIVEEWHYTLGRTKPDSTVSTQEHVFLKEWEGAIYKPHNP